MTPMEEIARGLGIGDTRTEKEKGEAEEKEKEDVAAWTEHGPVPCGFR